jgi:hypothetical protein
MPGFRKGKAKGEEKEDERKEGVDPRRENEIMTSVFVAMIGGQDKIMMFPYLIFG